MLLIRKILSLSRTIKRLILLALDLILLLFAWWLALSLRYGEWWPAIIADAWWSFIAVIAIGVPIFIHFGLYRTVVRYMGEQILWTVAQGVGLTTLLLAFVTLLIGTAGIPRSSFFIFYSTAFLLVVGSRFIIRNYYNTFYKINRISERVAIYGAGNAGAQVAAALLCGHHAMPIAFIDDNPSLWGATVNGIRVYAPNTIPEIIHSLRINTILLAMPKLKRAARFAIVNSLKTLPIQVRTIPGMAELIAAPTNFNTFREIAIEDLLGRDPVTPNQELLHSCIQNKSVLVTGAGGSIGSELCRQILPLLPKRLVLFELSEFALYKIEQELRQISAQAAIAMDIFAIIGSVQDQKRIHSVLQTFAIQTVYHAAAYKHVPLVEQNLIEGIRNNAFGTKILAEAAVACGVERLVLISTDKAVRPTNVMGASKRLAELILQELASSNIKTILCMVRFGNVLGSSGSVVPLFRQQIDQGGPITLTHKEVTRYFMTIPEAAQLVIQAGAMAHGGDVFVLDMGQPMRIYDLACTMIRLSGLEIKDATNSDGDIEIVITGLRPGEKLYEELLIGDNVEPTEHPLISRAMDPKLPPLQLMQALLDLECACNTGDLIQIKQVLNQTIVGYTSTNEIVDVVWQNRL